MGPDGFSKAFFKEKWSIIKGDLMNVFENFYETRVVNGIVSEIYICLIPKKKELSRVRDFRLISLVSGIYKIIAKILALRLRIVLGKCISNC